MALSQRPAARPARRLARLGAGAALALALVGGTASCGFDMQTMEPYTPSDGISRDVGAVKVRNLMILSKADGSGFLSGTLLSDGGEDSLTGVTGVPVKADQTNGQPLQITLSGPVRLPAGTLVVLTNTAAISVTGADLKPGLETKLDLTFEKAGKVNLIVPVVDGTARGYESVSPSAAPSA